LKTTIKINKAIIRENKKVVQISRPIQIWSFRRMMILRKKKNYLCFLWMLI